MEIFCKYFAIKQRREKSFLNLFTLSYDLLLCCVSGLPRFWIVDKNCYNNHFQYWLSPFKQTAQTAFCLLFSLTRRWIPLDCVAFAVVHQFNHDKIINFKGLSVIYFNYFKLSATLLGSNLMHVIKSAN